MRISASGFNPRHRRFEPSTPTSAEMEADDGIPVKAVIRDISASGVALNMATPYDNGTFVQVHIEGFGRMSGNVIRSYEGGVAVVFENRQDEKKVSKFNGLA